MDAVLGFIYHQKPPNTVRKAERDTQQAYSTVAQTFQGNWPMLAPQSHYRRTTMPSEAVILGNYGDSLHIATQYQAQSLHCPILFVR